MKKKLRKSTWVTAALLVYVTAMAIYFLPHNNQMGSTEKYITLAVAYVIVIALWFLLRKKEQLRRRREEEENNRTLNNNVK